MSIGTFTLIKDEAQWIAPHIMQILDYIDEMVFFDGNSTDGTLEIIEAIKAEYDKQDKIKLYRNQDPKDLRDDYVRMFNEAMHELKTDLAWFLHPDMFVCNPDAIKDFAKSDCIAAYCMMESYAGDPGADLLKIETGRCDRWKNIYRLKNPDLGAHYHGWYGAQNEDIYFSEITGNVHEYHGVDFSKYPYRVEDSGIEVMHFSDVRTYARRLGRMISCLRNQGYAEAELENMAKNHPRVTLKDGAGFTFYPAKYPDAIGHWNAKFAGCKKYLYAEAA